MTDCIFCRIVAGEIPNHTVYEDEHVLAFLDIMPVAQGHMLVIPKQHSKTIPDLPSTDLVHLSMVAKTLDARLREKLGCDAVTLLLRDGPAAGQEVPHVHLHLIPRSEGDGLGVGYPGGDKAEADELSELAEQLAD